MTTAAQVLATAANEIGTVESPAGSNRQKYGAYFNENGQPWCAFFDAWCFAQNGIVIPTVLNIPTWEVGYCPDVVLAYKAKGWWHTFPDVQPGDQVFYCWDGSGVAEHTGIVQEVIAGPLIVSIEGNTSLGDNSNGGEVMRRERDPHFAVGFGRIPYTAPIPPKEPDMPVFICTKNAAGVAGAWFLYDGYKKRQVGPGENTLLVDLGLVAANTVKVISPAQLAAIPNA